VPQVINEGSAGEGPSPEELLSDIRQAFWALGRYMGQVRVHERLLHLAGVRLERAGAALLYVLHTNGACRVTRLADLLGVDAPTVTRKIQQLEREGLVARKADADDGRATRIELTEPGRETLERVLAARRVWFDRLLEGWEAQDLKLFASMLRRFASALEDDLADDRGRAR
jgi:DNA-binding MarR family transcriptional regulator